jgi:hypothetical protein
MTLLKTLAELKEYVMLDANTDIPTGIRKEMPDVENKFVAPLLGPTLRAWLQAQYDAPGFDLTAATPAAELLRLVQAPIARLAVAAGLTAHQARIDGTGVHIMSTETSKTAFQWQVDELRATNREKGWSDLDLLVQWLEENHESTTQLQAWASSAAGQRHRRELFTCTADFHEYENILEARRTFLALAPIRRRLEDFSLAPVLSEAFLFELRDQVRTRALTSDNENLLRSYVYPALASLTIGHAVTELRLRLAGEGVALSHEAQAKPIDPGLQRLLKDKVEDSIQNGVRYLGRLRDYLDRTASTTRFATYFSSSAYTAPAPAASPTNTAQSRIYKLV